MTARNNYQRESVEGGYLVVYVNEEKFTPEVRSHQSWDDGDYYTLVETHPETIRLAECFKVYPVIYDMVSVRVQEEEKHGFFGRKNKVKTYTFKCNRLEEEFQSDLVYLEK